MNPDASILLQALGHDGYLSVGWQPPGGTFLHRVGTPATALAKIDELGDTADVWYGVNRMADPPARGGRGEASDITRVTCLYADLDPGKPGYPPTLSDALAIIDGLPDPGFIVHSGHGGQPIWLLTGAEFDTSTPERHADITALLKRWGQLIAGRARARDWKVDPVWDLARILRVPGTLNLKDPARPVRARLEQLGGVPLTYDDVAGLLAEHERPPRVSSLFQQPAQRIPTGYTAPDLGVLVTGGVPAGTDQDPQLRDAVWDCARAGMSKESAHAVWDAVVARTVLLRPGQPWTDADFERHWSGVTKITGPGPGITGMLPAAGPVPAVTVSPVEQRKAMLRIDAQARAELAAESAPPAPAAVDGSAFLAQADEEQRWRITGLMPAGGNVVLAAQYKAGKTTMRDNLIRSWCDGTPFLGSYDIIPAPGPVLVIDTEMSMATARRWLRAHAIADPARFRFVSLRGAAAALNVLTPAGRRQWAQIGAGCSAVILDCIGPVLGALGLSESENPDVIRFFDGWDAMLAEAGIPESVVIHHMGHAGERARGAARFRDWPDSGWTLVRQDDNPRSPRYFSAYGRDVDVAESALAYDEPSRLLTITGGSRRETSSAAVAGALTELLTAKPGLSTRQIEEALSDSNREDVRGGIKLARASGIIRTEPGPRRATLHYLVAEQCASAPVRATAHWHTGAEQCAPPIRGALAHSDPDPAAVIKNGALKQAGCRAIRAEDGQECGAPTTGDRCLSHAEAAAS